MKLTFLHLNSYSIIHYAVVVSFYATYTFQKAKLIRFINRPMMGFKGHLRDLTLTSCQKGSYLCINRLIIEFKKSTMAEESCIITP